MKCRSEEKSTSWALLNQKCSNQFSNLFLLFPEYFQPIITAIKTVSTTIEFVKWRLLEEFINLITVDQFSNPCIQL